MADTESPVRWRSRPRLSRRRKHLAQPPGALVHIGSKRAEATSIRRVDYDEANCAIAESDEIHALERGEDLGGVTWLHVTGLHETERLSTFGERFGISSLTLEDILDTRLRPKIEKRDDEIFAVAKLITMDAESGKVDLQQLSLLLLPGNVLISFLEGPTPAFDPILERIRTGRGGRIRRLGADYLLWALLDATVDHYLFVIDQMDEALGAMELRLQEDAADVEAAELYGLKRDIGRLFRSIRPIREITGSLVRRTSPLLDEESAPYFGDLNDHALEVLENTEYLRESASALRDFYLSAVSNRMNEIMKVLTCFSTIFLPLTFVAGVYGMNFERMPELGFSWAYPAVWVVFALCAAGMFGLFRHKNWL